MRPRRHVQRSTVTLAGSLAAVLALGPAQIAHSQAPAPQPSGPAHAWLFGTWTGGLFPAPGSVTAAACLAAPVVIFTRDVVLRATLTDPTFVQREVETVRASPQGAEFRFLHGGQTTGRALLGLGGPAPVIGFSCEDPDVLHVQRRGENEIAFPGCADFPNPLVRCPSR